MNTPRTGCLLADSIGSFAPRRALAAILLAAPLAPFVACTHRDAPTATTADTLAAVAPATRYSAYVDGNPVPVTPQGDPDTIRRILDEGANRNRVMEHLTYLSTQIGPRLTGSSNTEKANNWARDLFAAWGLANAHLDQWGTIPVRFDRGPSTGKVQVKQRRRAEDGETVTFRTVRDMQFTTLAWAAGTNGPARGRVLWMPESDEEYEQVKDSLKDAWILLKAPPPGGGGMRGGGASARYSHRKEVRQKASSSEDFDPATLPVDDRVLFAGIHGFISVSRDDRDRVWTSSVPAWRSLDPAAIPSDVEVIVRLSDYDYLNSRLADGEEIYAEFDLPHTFTPGPIPVYNTVAEIPGTTWPEQVVIVSAHLDSWNGPGSQGTTDNGTGSCVTLEAARILMAAGAKPGRTIRFILWTGEEQGLLGSREYVRQNEAILDNISCVFVDDGGTNYQGGLPALASMVPMLAAATAPVNGVFFDSADNKPLTVNIRTVNRMPRGGSSDHASFNARGVPGFFWDEVGRADYGFGWHTQHDTIALAIPEYLMQSATCTAVTAYNLACADSMLPRAPREEPREGEQPQDQQRQRRRDSQASGGAGGTGLQPVSALVASDR
jgi:hypothetical protein